MDQHSRSGSNTPWPSSNRGTTGCQDSHQCNCQSISGRRCRIVQSSPGVGCLPCAGLHQHIAISLCFSHTVPLAYTSCWQECRTKLYNQHQFIIRHVIFTRWCGQWAVCVVGLVLLMLLLVVHVVGQDTIFSKWTITYIRLCQCVLVLPTHVAEMWWDARCI